MRLVIHGTSALKTTAVHVTEVHSKRSGEPRQLPAECCGGMELDAECCRGFGVGLE